MFAKPISLWRLLVEHLRHRKREEPPRSTGVPPVIPPPNPSDANRKTSDSKPANDLDLTGSWLEL